MAYRVELARKAEVDLEEIYLLGHRARGKPGRGVVQRSRTRNSLSRAAAQPMSDRLRDLFRGKRARKERETGTPTGTVRGRSALEKPVGRQHAGTTRDVGGVDGTRNLRTTCLQLSDGVRLLVLSDAVTSSWRSDDSRPLSSGVHLSQPASWRHFGDGDLRSS